ncbi:unnamed protein product [Paramecium sonneborni]|uniref:Copine n=1 Tax=Paramecium sonneborni TaxID=65129 RepID=A0A8S1KAK8_9CILI|nr:unnamed protein product [Paramecium sonneborni]
MSQSKFFVVRIKCYELVQNQNNSEINCMVVVKEYADNQWNEKGKTEIQKNQRNPQFSTAIQLNYQFEMSYRVLFQVLNTNKEQSNVIGQTELNIQTLLTAKDQIYSTDIINQGKKAGRIVIIGEYQKYKNDMIEIILTAKQLYTQCCIFKAQPSKPYIKISRTFQDTHVSNLVYQSEPINYPEIKSWPEIKRLARDICNNDREAVLQIEIYDKGSRQETYIGSINLSVSQMEEKQVHRNIQHKGNRKITGQLYVEKCLLREIATFEQYLEEGLQLNLIISIDFTDSNLDPNNPQSLHYFDRTNKKLSQYEQALRNVSEILIQYDHDKKVPLYGFGFELNGKAHHCYPLNNNLEDPEVTDLIGVFETYRNFVKTVKFSGPTTFRPTVREAMRIAKGFKTAGSEKYVVLTILTDGIISDFDGTFESIVDCCELPISIIIIGIGDADFKLMQRLNNNQLMEEDIQGRKATRDLVKFVVFNNYKSELKKFAEEVLSELPDQVVNYMTTICKIPGSKEQKNYPQYGSNFNFDQYYQSKNFQRQGTLHRLLGEEDEDFQTGQKTIIDLRQQQEVSLKQPIIFQQQEQGQGSQTYSQHYYPQVYGHIQTPFQTNQGQQNNFNENFTVSNQQNSLQNQNQTSTLLDGLISNHQPQIQTQPILQVSQIFKNPEENENSQNQNQEESFPLIQSQKEIQEDNEREQQNQDQNKQN